MITDLIKNKSILLPIFIYWAVLILFMNLFKIPAQSGFMITIKIGLLIYIIVSFLKKTKNLTIKHSNITVFLMFSVFIFSKIFFENLSFKYLINYLYLYVLCLLIFVLCDSLIISKKELRAFFKLFIYFNIFCVIYALIFQTSYFISASSLMRSYNHELKSIFLSNHEYAYCLCVGIIGILFNLSEEKNKEKFYSILLVVFIVNLLLTFSRSAIMGLAVFIAFYSFYLPNKKFKILSFLIIILILITYLLLPLLQNWVFRILLKENNDANRFDMWNYFINLYKSFSFENKLLGIGYNKLIHLVNRNFNHHNTHNGFLQVLLIYGFIGFVFFVGIIISQIIHCTKIIKINKQDFGFLFGLILFSIPIMSFNTTILFGSLTDSFLLTIISIVIPKYVVNYIIEKHKIKN